MYCKKCGNKVNDSAAFCKKCGYRFQTGDKPADVQARASVKASVRSSPVRVKPAAAEAVSAGVKPRARVNKYFVIGLAAILVVVAAVVVIINFVVKATKSDEDIIIEAFKNTFGADSYKYTLKCNPIYKYKGYDKDSQYISYVEKASDKDETILYKKYEYKKKDADDICAEYAYINGKYFVKTNDAYEEKSLDDKQKKLYKKELNNYYYIVGDDGTTTLYNVVTPNASSALGTMLEKYFQNGKLDCVKEYTKKDNKYFFKLDYSALVKSLDVDYGKSVRKNIVQLFSKDVDFDIKYTLNIDFTVNKDKLKNMNAVLIAEYKNEYVKLAKWNFKFENINELKLEDCEVTGVKKITLDDVHSENLPVANENAKIVYDIMLDFCRQYVDLDNYTPDEAAEVANFSLKEYSKTSRFNYDSLSDEELSDDYYEEKIYRALSKKSNSNFGRVYFGTAKINGKYDFFAQWAGNGVIGQYPNPINLKGLNSNEIKFGTYYPN